MSATTNILLFGAVGLAAFWWLNRKSYFVISDDGYEYFSDLGQAKDFRKEHRGDLYEIPAGAEFDGTRRDPDPKAKRLTPNKRRRRKHGRRR
jgi:hypothetical protein